MCPSLIAVAFFPVLGYCDRTAHSGKCPTYSRGTWVTFQCVAVSTRASMDSLLGRSQYFGRQGERCDILGELKLPE